MLSLPDGADGETDGTGVPSILPVAAIAAPEWMMDSQAFTGTIAKIGTNISPHAPMHIFLNIFLIIKVPPVYFLV